MSVSYYRPQIHNGPIHKRPARVARLRRSWRAAVRGRGRAEGRLGALCLLIATGMAIAAGFVFGLHLHFSAQRVGQDAVELRSQLERTVAEGRELEVKRQRAISYQEIERQLGVGGRLGPYHLDAPEVLRALAPAPEPKR